MQKDEMDQIAKSLKSVAEAVTPLGAVAGTDSAGTHVSSLTEAVMGVTAGLYRIANAIEKLADAVEMHD